MRVVEVQPSHPDDKKSLAQRLFIQHSAHLRGFIVALLPDLAQVDDVFQETFVTVTAKADAFDPDRDFLAWACGIARLKVREAGRRAARQWRPLSDEVLDALAASEPAVAAEDQRLGLLVDCVQGLAPQSRRIVELCYQQAHKPAEIARLVQWSVESVYVALSRARAVLRQCVDRKLAAEEVTP
jgi:RNA polymerase sigma-70 factor, ECF subfamily